MASCTKPCKKYDLTYCRVLEILSGNSIKLVIAVSAVKKANERRDVKANVPQF